MKLTAALSYLLVVLPVLVSATAIADSSSLVARQNGGRQFGRQGNNGNNNNNGQNNNNNNNNNNNGGNNNNNNNNGQNNNNNQGGGDPQTSLTLDPAVIAPGFANNGQENGADPGQVPSLTSTNNFINFCLTVNKPITNGQQITGGSCNPAPIGVVASTANMPSSKFVNPKNGDTIQANQAFTIQMAVRNLVTGNFVNAQTNYFAAPQQIDGGGNIIGHTHVVIEELDALDQTTATDPTRFAFFKGVNGAAQGGVVTADVTNGLPAGVYRLASINSAANHQPVIVAVAQHGSLDDMVYFTVSDNAAADQAGAGAGDAQNGQNGQNGGQNNGGQNNGQQGGQNGQQGGQNGQQGGQNGQQGGQNGQQGGQNGQQGGQNGQQGGQNGNRFGQGGGQGGRQGGRGRRFSREAF